MDQKLTGSGFRPLTPLKEFNQAIKEKRLRKSGFAVLVWMWGEADPYTGICHVSYQAVASEGPIETTYINARKIISELREGHFVYFPNHSGKKGHFPVYLIGYYTAYKKILTWELVTGRLAKKANSQVETIPDTKPEDVSAHNLDEPIHRLQEQRTQLNRHFSMQNNDTQFTGSYTNNDTKYLKHRDRSTYKKVDTQLFNPQSREEQMCKDIAITLGETDMRFILSCLRKYGIRVIETNWVSFKELKNSRNDIKNPAAYFNRMIKKNVSGN